MSGTLKGGAAALEISDLHFAYSGGRELFGGLNLRIDRGEIAAVTGESGSGKSTILDLIAGNLKARRGSITAARFGWIFQDPYTSFHPTYKIGNQIADVAPLDDSERLCERLGIDSALLSRKPHTLSGGQLQRLSILRALLMKPELILADEPTSALDYVAQLDVMKLLLSLLDGAGILLITHDLSLAAWCADRVIELKRE